MKGQLDLHKQLSFVWDKTYYVICVALITISCISLITSFCPPLVSECLSARPLVLLRCAGARGVDSHGVSLFVL